MEAVSEQDKVTLVGFGSFEPRDRKEREGRNPKTEGEAITPSNSSELVVGVDPSAKRRVAEIIVQRPGDTNTITGQIDKFTGASEVIVGVTGISNQIKIEIVIEDSQVNMVVDKIITASSVFAGIENVMPVPPEPILIYTIEPNQFFSTGIGDGFSANEAAEAYLDDYLFDLDADRLVSPTGFYNEFIDDYGYIY